MSWTFTAGTFFLSPSTYNVCAPCLLFDNFQAIDQEPSMAKMSSTASTAASFAGDKPPSIRPTKSSSTEQSFHSCEQQSFYSCESHAASEKTPTPSQEDDQLPAPNNWIEVWAQCYWRDVADDHKEEDRRQGISRAAAKRAFLCMPNAIHPPSQCASRSLCADELEGRTPLREYIGDTLQSEENDEVENSDMVQDLVGDEATLRLSTSVRANVFVTERYSGMFGCFHGWL